MIHCHYRELYPTPGRSYRANVDALIGRVFRQEPWLDLIRASLRHPCLGVPDDEPDLIAERLDALCALPVEPVARAALDRLTALVPPPTATIECHLVPGRAADRNGGLSFAPGRILVGVPISADWQIRLQRGLTHEYSHAVRMALYPQDEQTVREALVLEGLAEALADELYPAPALKDAPSSVGAWWRRATPHLEERGLDAYIRHVLAPGGYAAAEDLVRRHLRATGHTAVSRQRAPAATILSPAGQII